MNGYAILFLGFIIVLLIVSAFIGNIELIQLLCGSELPDGQGFLVFIAIISDIIMIYLLVSRIVKNINKVNEEKEKSRIESVKQEIKSIKSKYSPKKLPISTNKPKSQVSFDNIYINTEINKIVNEFKKSMRQYIVECQAIDNKINKILSYYSESDPDTILEYLSEKIDELNELKEKSDSLHAIIDKKRIVLLNEDKDAVECIRDAFFKLKRSKRCSLNNTSINDLVNGKKPLELNMFSYECGTLILYYHKCSYCFFSNVILVFDNQGIYLNALDPAILRLSITRHTETNQNGKNTSTDSKIVYKGEIRKTWRYTCLDGTPDLRYKDSPMSEYHIDELMYGEVSFYLSGNLTYTFSSYQAIIALEKAKEEYEKRYNDRRNALPDFLNLMQILEPENAMMNDISKKYKAKSTSYFCKIT